MFVFCTDRDGGMVFIFSHENIAKCSNKKYLILMHTTYSSMYVYVHEVSKGVTHLFLWVTLY